MTYDGEQLKQRYLTGARYKPTKISVVQLLIISCPFKRMKISNQKEYKHDPV